MINGCVKLKCLNGQVARFICLDTVWGHFCAGNVAISITDEDIEYIHELLGEFDSGIYYEHKDTDDIKTSKRYDTWDTWKNIISRYKIYTEILDTYNIDSSSAFMLNDDMYREIVISKK